MRQFKLFLSVFGVTAAALTANKDFATAVTNKSPAMPPAPPQQKNWVTVRIWQARDSQGNLTTPEAVMRGKEPRTAEFPAASLPPRVGHASVESRGIYASFWPKDGAGKTRSFWKPSIKTPVAGQNNPSLQTDIQSERGEATTEETFYSLDHKAVRKEFEKMLVQQPNYVMKRSAVLTKLFAQHNSENCTTAAYRVLKAGGINQLSPACAALDSKWVAMSPNDLQTCIKAAKLKELSMHPETRSFAPSNSS